MPLMVCILAHSPGPCVSAWLAGVVGQSGRQRFSAKPVRSRPWAGGPVVQPLPPHQLPRAASLAHEHVLIAGLDPIHVTEGPAREVLKSHHSPLSLPPRRPPRRLEPTFGVVAQGVCSRGDTANPLGSSPAHADACHRNSRRRVCERSGVDRYMDHTRDGRRLANATGRHSFQERGPSGAPPCRICLVAHSSRWPQRWQTSMSLSPGLWRYM